MNSFKLLKIYIFIFIVYFIFFSTSLTAQVSNNKSGGICFRFDDNLPLDQLTQVADIFNKYKVKYCLSLNLASPPDPIHYIPFIQKLDRDGFQIMDHAPNHCTNAFWTDDALVYNNRLGVDHLNIPSRMVCLKYEELDNNIFFAPGFVTSTGQNLIISKTNGGFKTFNTETQYLYFPSLNKIANPEAINNLNSNDPDTMRLRNFWGEQINVGENANFLYYTLNNNDVHMTDGARALLGEESLRLFKKYHLQRPVTWIQPGGKTPQFTPEEIKKTFADRFRYSSGGSNGGLQCYNDAVGDARFAMQWGDFSGGVNVVSLDKNKIANQIAKHYFLIGGSHFWDVTIPWNLYLTRIDSILYWCQQKKIPVNTYSQWTKLLYNTPQNPYTNIFPSLNNDLDENNVPDGYDLKNGKLDKMDGPEKGAYSIVVLKKDTICEINGLAGLEKGENEFFIYTKGSPGNFITVSIQFQENKHTTITYKFPAENNTWTRYSPKESLYGNKTLIIPSNYSYANIMVSCSDFKGGIVKIGGMKLNKKLGNPLYIISKPDTLIRSNAKYEYQVITAKHNLKDKLSYKLINPPLWLTIDSLGFISGIPVSFSGELPIIIQVRDQSGNVTKQSYAIQLKKTNYLVNILIRLFIHFIFQFEPFV